MTAGIPQPSDAVLLKLAGIAAQVKELTPDNPRDKEVVGLTTARNDRRRTMEAVLVLLADPDVRDYLAALDQLGLLPSKR